MKIFYDQAPTKSYADVCAVLTEEFGKGPNELFEEFEERPFASASLAQVHRAITHQGDKVAVKVQHRGIYEASRADLAAVKVLVKAVHILFPELHYQWLVDEFEQNLPLELDFAHEAKNCERCRDNFKHRKNVVFPRIFWSLTTRRVLTMELVTGCVVNDSKSILDLQLSPNSVSKLMSEIFSEMIFVHGFVHCDPHPGNLLVRAHGDTQTPEIVLLDHGLYRELDDEFRINYCNLWKSLIFADIDGIKKYCHKMNAGESWKLFASMLTLRPWGAEKLPDVTSDNALDKHVLQKYGRTLLYEISDILDKIPRHVLLLLKTNDCLRAVNAGLGVPNITPVVMSRYCLKGLNMNRLSQNPGLMSQIAIWWEQWQLEFRIFQKYIQFAWALLCGAFFNK